MTQNTLIFINHYIAGNTDNVLKAYKCTDLTKRPKLGNAWYNNKEASECTKQKSLLF